MKLTSLIVIDMKRDHYDKRIVITKKKNVEVLAK